MRPQRGISFHSPDNGTTGDCFRTCVAAILDMKAEDVPHFYEGVFDHNWTPEIGEKVLDAIDKWLSDQGLKMVKFCLPGHLGSEEVVSIAQSFSDLPFILTGVTLEKENHAVVYWKGGVACDPNESSIGLVGPRKQADDWLVEFIVKPPLESYL